MGDAVFMLHDVSRCTIIHWISVGGLELDRTFCVSFVLLVIARSCWSVLLEGGGVAEQWMSGNHPATISLLNMYYLMSHSIRSDNE